MVAPRVRRNEKEHFVKHKTSELTGALLDAAVMKAANRTDPTVDMGRSFHYRKWEPSTVWEDGGPIIERERISLEAPNEHDYGSDQWTADFEHSARSDGVQRSYGSGSTPLVAAMRAYCHAKLGDEVEL